MLKVTTFAAIRQISALHAKYLRIYWIDLYELCRFGRHIGGDYYFIFMIKFADRTCRCIVSREKATYYMFRVTTFCVVNSRFQLSCLRSYASSTISSAQIQAMSTAYYFGKSVRCLRQIFRGSDLPKIFKIGYF